MKEMKHSENNIDLSVFVMHRKKKSSIRVNGRTVLMRVCIDI
jgi:hypothetical protein